MSSIHFTLSSRKPWNATYRTQDGQVIYKVESTMPKLGARNIKILKVVPSFADNRITRGEQDAEHLRDSFASLAAVDYRTFSSSRIRMGDLDVATGDHFKKVGSAISRFVGRHRVFTGPHGKEYLWRLGRKTCKLFVNDSGRTPVARFHRRWLSTVGDDPPVSLEIFAAGKDMVDLIVVTGAYMEKVRKSKE